MQNRSVRLVLLLLFVLAAAGTIFQDMRFDAAIARERAAAADVDRDFAALDVTLADFRAAQAGYVAVGQGAQFWMTRAADLTAQLDETVERLATATTSEAAKAHYQAARAALAELLKIDQKARQNVTNDQRYLASDLIFVDALGAARKLGGALDAAADEERRSAETRMARTNRMRFAMTAGALGFGALVALALLKRQTVVAEAEAQTVMLAPPPPAPKPIATVAMPSIPAAPPQPPPQVNLSDVAELCVDLGRVGTSREMPAMLERTATVLGAKGVIVWMIDTSGAFLRPLLSHGYPEKVMQRLGRLQVDADNVTSLAYRSTQPQTINAGSADASGAIAVPLVTSARCIGVLSAEVSRAKPDRDTVSAARMIAAQLAALAVPAESSATPQAAARG
jgi:hypothetical protein